MGLVGKRVRLVRCTDEWTRLKPGTEGTVSLVDDVGTVHVRWDDGSQLGLVAAAGDRFEVLRPDEMAVSSLADVYEALERAETALADLARLAQRHLPLDLQRAAERSLRLVLDVKARVMPAPDAEGPF